MGRILGTTVFKVLEMNDEITKKKRMRRQRRERRTRHMFSWKPKKSRISRRKGGSTHISKAAKTSKVPRTEQMSFGFGKWDDLVKLQNFP